jgi:RNA polymerase sigma-70 factor (ECF subfamily)
MARVPRARSPGPELEAATAPPGEASLVALAQRDPRAFAPLYRAYFDPVYRYCLRGLGDREAAADATQEVFTKALAALPRFRDEAFRPWVFAIAHNVVVDAHRRRGRRPHEAPLDAAACQVDPAPAPDQVALSDEAKYSVHALLVQLPADQRAVVELRLADLTGKEVAAVLGRSLGSVKIAQHRAFRRLRDLMAADADGAEDRDGRPGPRPPRPLRRRPRCADPEPAASRRERRLGPRRNRPPPAGA